MTVFKERHRHAIWGQATPSSLHSYALTPTHTDVPSIHAVASVMGDTLYVSYFIEHSDSLDCCTVDVPQRVTLTRQDYLWQANCLECFFDIGQEGYFEMNFSPEGGFNLYEFEGYRTPSHLPPRWAEGMVFMLHDTTLLGYHTHHLGIKLDNHPSLPIHRINPAVILYHDGTPIYYAIRHASPPDFHDKDYWVTLGSHP